MTLGIAHRIAACFLVLLVAMTPALGQTANLGGAPATSLAPDHRSPQGYWNATSREAGAIQDEMLAHRGKDNVLNAFDEDRFANRAVYAEHWAKQQNEVEFRDILRQLERERVDIEARATQIDALRSRVAKELDAELTRWNDLLGANSMIEELAKNFGVEIGTAVGSKLFGWLGAQISSKIASVIVAGTGKALGPVSTLVSVYQFFDEYAEYAEMKLMLDRMLERVEMVAYLDVLIKKYDGVIAMQDKVIDDLIMSFSSYSRSACR